MAALAITITFLALHLRQDTNDLSRGLRGEPAAEGRGRPSLLAGIISVLNLFYFRLSAAVNMPNGM